jgi:hypothetical protein
VQCGVAGDDRPLTAVKAPRHRLIVCAQEDDDAHPSPKFYQFIACSMIGAPETRHSRHGQNRWQNPYAALI